MSNTEHQSVSNMSERRLRELHLYKELMSAEERQGRYLLLKGAGASPGQARKWRDWSPNHFQMILDLLLKPPKAISDPLYLDNAELTA